MPFPLPNQQRRSTEGTHLLCWHTHTHPFNSLFPGLPGWACTRKVTPVWIFVKQETVSGSGISWAVCKSAPRSRQITTPAPHYSVFYRPDALPAAQPTASKALKAPTSTSLIINVTHTHPFNGTFSGSTQVSRYQKINLDFTGARDSEWQSMSIGNN